MSRDASARKLPEAIRKEEKPVAGLAARGHYGPMSSPIRILTLSVVSVAVLSSRQPNVPLRTGTVSLTIGAGDESRDDYMFSTVSGLAFDAAGRIVVTDIRDNVVRVYSPSGTFLYRIGRQGAGPGEFRAPIGATMSSDGLLWVQDEGNRRFNAYSLGTSSAAYQASVQYQLQPAFGYRFQPLSFGSDGRLIALGSVMAAPGEYTALRQSLSRAGLILHVDTIPAPVDDSLGSMQVTTQRGEGRGTVWGTRLYTQAYGPEFQFAQSPGGSTARVVTSRYDIEWRDASGRIVHRIQRDVTGPELSAREQKIAQERIDDFINATKIPRASLTKGLRDRKVPIRRIAFDQIGRLWVERMTRDSTPREADVYDATGKQIAVMRWPREILLLDYATVAARNDEVLGVASDSFDVERVVRLRFR